MTVLCCYKVLVFMLVAILLIDFTNLAKADNADNDYNYDRYDNYDRYQSSTYSFF